MDEGHWTEGITDQRAIRPKWHLAELRLSCDIRPKWIEHLLISVNVQQETELVKGMTIDRRYDVWQKKLTIFHYYYIMTGSARYPDLA
jgi:hypothetical protein